MARTRIMLLLGLVFALMSGLGHAQDENSSSDSLIRLLSPELRQTEKRLAEIEHQMKSLPDVKERPWGSRYGHRSADLPTETSPDWFQIDFGKESKIDLLAMMPANLSNRAQEAAGYGFPKRFRIEISNHADMSEAVVLVDRSKSDVPNPGKYPLVFEIKPITGRYLRLTSLKHNSDKEAYFWAIEELMAMDRNLIIKAELKTTQSSSMDLFPLWAPVRAVDGQSTLGMPVDVTQPSPTQGYLSSKLSMSIAKDPLPEMHTKWCAVDLGKPEVIEQVRLLPLESDAYEVFGGRGFPRQFKLQFSNDPDFKEIVWEDGRGAYSLGYPNSCSVNIPIPSVRAQYVRVKATAMWSRDGWFSFGLAELQVYGSNQNLALGKKAYAKDASDKSEEVWAPAHLVDGYSSRYRLIEWPEYLYLLDKRAQLENEMADLDARRFAKLKTGRKLLVGFGVFLAVLAVSGWIWVLVRQRVMIRREAEHLRQQIARDLHDDIGSNLGGIVLLSEIGSQHSNDEDSRSDFETIRQAAADASSSMRDIVWLIQREPVGLKDFVTRMRQSLHMILKHHDVTMDVEPLEFRERSLSLLFRRHVFLAFKEVLNNARKHSQSSQVAVKVEIEPSGFRFTVQDQGVGFDPELAGNTGYGLGNLKRRASRVSGSVAIDSSPSTGTKVTFEAPFL